MAMTKAYLQYLNQHIEIAPANSQEEVDAAAAIESVLRSQTGLSVEKHDIAGPAEINFVYGLLGAIFFIGVLLSGIGGLVCALLGLLFAAFGFVFLFLRFLNIDVLSHTLPVGRSQNLVAHHKGYGPHSGHGTRPIVVMAHYDTGKEEFLYKPSIARYSSVLFTIAPIASAVAAACCLLQIFLFLPDVFLRIFWVIGLIAALPALIWAINNIAAKFMPLSGAANDNNASVAALLGVVEDVCVSDPSKRAERRATLLEVAAKEAEEARELGLEGFADVSNTVLPEEKAAELENPVTNGEKPAEQDSLVGRASLVEDTLTTSEKSASTADGEPAKELQAKGKAEANLEAVTDGKAASEAVAQMDLQTAEVEAGESTLSADASFADTDNKVKKVDAPANNNLNDDEKSTYEGATPEGNLDDISTAQVVPETIPEFTAIRHGADVIKEMKILPDYCDLEYVEELVVETAPEANETLLEHADMHEKGEIEGILEEDVYGEELSQSETRTSSRRARRRAAAQPQTPLEKLQSFFASVPSPADVLASLKGKQSSDDSRRERGHRGQTAPAAQSAHEDAAKVSNEGVIQEQSTQVSETLVSELMTSGQLTSEVPALEQLKTEGAQHTQAAQDTTTQAGEPSTPKTPKQASSHESIAPEIAKPADARNTGEPSLDAEISQALKKAELSETKEEGAPTQTSPEEGKPAGRENNETDADENPQKEVSDPLWGTSSFEPINDHKNVAKRAALFDLPDPSVATVDPLSEDFQIQHTGEIDPRDFPVEEFGATGVISAEENTVQQAGAFEVLHEDLTQISTEGTKDTSPKHEEKPGPWKGGATFSEAARDDKDADDAEKQTELEEAVLDMDYVDLVSHDIWFVLTGGAGLDHAGAKTFFREHKKDLRGACVINLEAVGAGELTALTEEGFGFNKKADHRMLRFFKSISRDLHIPLLREKHVWADTEATSAMREKLRSVTLMGTDQGQIPALAHTDQNVPENVDPNQVAQANMIVSELIRRL